MSFCFTGYFHPRPAPVRRDRSTTVLPREVEVEAMAAIMEELQAATARITATAVLKANTGEFTVNY